MSDIENYILEEAFSIEQSGEMPEVAYHESLYFLTKDKEGPCLRLREEQLLPLKKAVIQRYITIIHRDLIPENRDKKIYRGVERCVANWQRLNTFCRRTDMDVSHIRGEVKAALRTFINREVMDCRDGNRASCINCKTARLEGFLEDLGLDSCELAEGWQNLCLL